jgi:hypothetical protein
MSASMRCWVAMRSWISGIPSSGGSDTSPGPRIPIVTTPSMCWSFIRWTPAFM